MNISIIDRAAELDGIIDGIQQERALFLTPKSSFDQTKSERLFQKHQKTYESDFDSPLADMLREKCPDEILMHLRSMCAEINTFVLIDSLDEEKESDITFEKVHQSSRREIEKALFYISIIEIGLLDVVIGDIYQTLMSICDWPFEILDLR